MTILLLIKFDNPDSRSTPTLSGTQQNGLTQISSSINHGKNIYDIKIQRLNYTKTENSLGNSKLLFLSNTFPSSRMKHQIQVILFGLIWT